MSLWNSVITEKSFEEFDKCINDGEIQKAYEKYKKGELDLKKCPPEIERLAKIFTPSWDGYLNLFS